jgi:hypothetical protein
MNFNPRDCHHFAGKMREVWHDLMAGMGNEIAVNYGFQSVQWFLRLNSSNKFLHMI